MVIVSHPTGNTFVRALLHALQEEHQLGMFFTTLGVHADDWLLRLLPAKLRRQALRRAYDIPHQALYRRPLRELTRHGASRLGPLAGLAQHESGWASVDAVYRDLDLQVARRLPGLQTQGAQDVYAYEDGALATFGAAQRLGMRRIYELPIAYWETNARLLGEEAERWPQWEPTLVGTRESAAKLERKTQELDAAQVVIVPSQFVLESLPIATRQSKPCHVVPFGSPTVAPSETEATRDNSDSLSRPLRVLFAGSMTQRKGLADLFAAMKQLKRRDVELVVMGSPLQPLEFYRQEYGEFRYEPPRPHHEVLALMRSCDVLALPSIAEGRALVQQEAMACGLPLLVTANAGGQDLIEEGKTGFLVPIRSPHVIAEKLDWLADHRESLPEMRRRAQAKAAQYTWQGYGNAIAAHIKNDSAGL